MTIQVGPQDNLDPSINAKNLFKELIEDTVVTSNIMLEKAQQNDPSTLCRIGNIYYSHKNPAFHTKGFGWYLLSANYPESQYNIGQCYSNGLGVQINYPLAMVWYKKAAENNYTRSFFKIGFLYHYGIGVEVNYIEARRWYVKAATFKDFKAEFNIGIIYEKGLAGIKDQNAATVWYTRSASSGFKLAQMKVKHRMRKGFQPNLNFVSVKNEIAFEELSMTETGQMVPRTCVTPLIGSKTVSNMHHTEVPKAVPTEMRRKVSKTLVECENQDMSQTYKPLPHIIDPTLEWKVRKKGLNIPIVKPQQPTTSEKLVVRRKPVNPQVTLNETDRLTQEIESMIEKMAFEEESKNQCGTSNIITSMLQDQLVSSDTMSMDGSTACNSEWSCNNVDISKLIQHKLNQGYSTLVEYADNFYSGGNMFLTHEE